MTPPDLSALVAATHTWRWHVRIGERFGQPCTVLARGRLNSALVQFSDGFKVVTSRYAVRKLAAKGRG